jgi:hypothetical protein
VCANLKSLLETGHVLPRAPWEMHNELRSAQMSRNDPRHPRSPSWRGAVDGELRFPGAGCRSGPGRFV